MGKGTIIAILPILKLRFYLQLLFMSDIDIQNF